MTTETATQTFYRPSPLATMDGEIVTPSDYLTRWLINGGERTPGWRGEIVPVVREIEDRHATTRRFWTVVDAKTGRELPNYTNKDANPIGPNSEVTIRAENGVLQPDWSVLVYSVNRGWILDQIQVSDNIDAWDEEGYPNLCERHELTDEVSALLAIIDPDADSTDSETEAAASQLDEVAPFAEYWVEGEYLCAEHFDAMGLVVYLTQYQREDSIGIHNRVLDVMNHAASTGMGTFSETVDVTPYADTALELTHADRWSLIMATGRLAEVRQRDLDRARNQHLTALVDGLENGTVTRETAIRGGVSERYVELMEREDS